MTTNTTTNHSLAEETVREHLKSLDTMRMDFLERQDIGRYDEVNGPDVFAVMFTLIEPCQNTLREAVDAAMAAAPGEDICVTR